MTEYRRVLDRARAEFRAPELSLESVLRRRDRKRRQQQVTAGVVGVAVAVVAIWAGTSIFRSDELRTAAYHHNGEIAVRASIGGGRDAIIQIDPATGHEVPLPIAGSSLRGWPYGPGTDLAWSPDGMELAYVLDSVWVLDIASGESREIMPCEKDARGCSIAWAPNGSSIAVAHDNAIELVSADGSSRTSLTPFGSGSTVQDPTWSPDGSRIAFVASVDDADGLHVIDRAGSGLQQLVELPSDAVGWMPVWSPDGSRIAYLSWEKASNDDGLLRVTTVDADGSDPTEVLRAGRCFCLGFTPGLAWSPDGTQMALVIPGPGSQPDGLYVMDADGTRLRLVREGAWARPVWRPVP